MRSPRARSRRIRALRDGRLIAEAIAIRRAIRPRRVRRAWRARARGRGHRRDAGSTRARAGFRCPRSVSRCRECPGRRRRSTPVPRDDRHSAPSALVMSPSAIGCAWPGIVTDAPRHREPHFAVVGGRRPLQAGGVDLDIAADERSRGGSRCGAEESGRNRRFDIAKLDRIAADCDVPLRRSGGASFAANEVQVELASQKWPRVDPPRNRYSRRAGRQDSARIPERALGIGQVNVPFRHRGEAGVGKARGRELYREQRNRRRERGEDEERARHVDWRALQRASVSSARTVPGSTRAVSVASTARRFPSRCSASSKAMSASYGTAANTT